MPRTSRRAVLVGTAALLGGCSSLPVVGSSGGGGGFEVTERYPSYQYDRRNSGRATGVTGPSAEPSVAWRTEIGPGNGGATPVVADGTVFVGNGDDTFQALEAGTGDTRWTASTRKWIHSTAAVGDDFVVFGCDDFVVRAFHWDGTERWTFRAGFEVSADPVLTDDRVYVTDTTGAVYALDRADGTEAWSTALEVGGGALSSPVLGDGRLYVASNDTTYALSTADGTVEWSTDDDRRVGGSLAVAGGTVVGANPGIGGGAVFALEAATGSVSWFEQLPHEYPNEAAVADGTVYLSAPDGLAARSLADGSVSWRAPLGGKSGTPVVVGDTVYCSGAGGVHAVEADGTVRWSADVGTDDSGLAVASETLFVKAATTLYAVR